jgi:hypothetical protein
MKRIKDSNDEYHSHKSISASGLKTIYKKSVNHYLNSVFKMSDAMNFGSAVHSAILEDSNDIVVLPEFNARTKEGKKIKQDFINDNIGKIVIKQEEKEAIDKIKFGKEFSKTINRNRSFLLW